MATKPLPSFDASTAFGDLTKMLEQFKVPGVDAMDVIMRMPQPELNVARQARL